MRAVANFVKTSLIGGVLVIIPAYLAALLLLKGLQGVMALLGPITAGLPEAMHFRTGVAAVIVVAVCFVSGVAVRTRLGEWLRGRFEKGVLERIPGYELIRGLTGRLVGKEGEQAFTVVLAEIEDALVPAFLVEECGDEQCVIFVPSAPTPAAGAIYIISKQRIHAVDIAFTRAIGVISKWGSGASELYAGMKRAEAAGAA